MNRRRRFPETGTCTGPCCKRRITKLASGLKHKWGFSKHSSNEMMVMVAMVPQWAKGLLQEGEEEAAYDSYHRETSREDIRQEAPIPSTPTYETPGDPQRDCTTKKRFARNLRWIICIASRLMSILYY